MVVHVGLSSHRKSSEFIYEVSPVIISTPLRYFILIKKTPSENYFLRNLFSLLVQDCEIKEEGKVHVLILHNCRLDQTGGVDFQAANVKSSAHLRVKRKYCMLLLNFQYTLLQNMNVSEINWNY